MAIPHEVIDTIGWTAQACFFGRMLIQWIASERVGRSVVPPSFWYLSLAGTLLGGVFAWLGPNDLIFTASYAFNVVPYLRNIMLARRPGDGLRSRYLVLISVAVAAGCCWMLWGDRRIRETWSEQSLLWLVVGVLGQGLWASRFLIQWVLAERRGRAELTLSFFVISLVASIMVLAYAVRLMSWPLIAGQVLSPVVYGRNLVLQLRHREASAPAVTPVASKPAVGVPAAASAAS